MNRNVNLLAALVITGGALSVAALGCEVIASPDRSKLPRETSGTGGMSSSSTGSTGGAGGMAGTCDAGQTCAQVAECPAPATACVLATCQGGCCGTISAAKATGCKEDGGGKLCDGNGACVACLAPTDCPTPTEKCLVAACDATAHTCGTAPTAMGTACAENGGKLCDDKGACVVCLAPTDCPVPATKCLIATCDATAHTCGTTPAALGATCTDNGGVVCDGTGVCVADHCADGVKDADETDVDCGGVDCTTCADGQKCLTASDCTDQVCGGMLTGNCTTACTCNAPTCMDGVQNGQETDKDCGGPVCDAAGKTCALGLGCGAAADCTGSAACSGTMFTPAPSCSGNVCTAGVAVDCAASSQGCALPGGCGACNTVADCPTPPNECTVNTCSGNTCGTTFPDMTHTLSSGQTAGNCQKLVCDGAGNIVTADDPTDPPPASGTACATSPTCSGSPLAPTYTLQPTGTDCTADNKLPKHVCGDTTDNTVKGTCVECNTPSDCPSDGGMGGGSTTSCTNHACM